jgi:methylated-DNA-protein-cysteine methyltransferase-like protein
MPSTAAKPAGSFFSRVYAAVQKIPRGRVATYGQVAAVLGSPRAAQAVGWALAVCDPKVVPWQRVVGKDGWLTIVNEHLPADMQAQLLEREGVAIEKENGVWRVVNFPNFLWKP